jgi:hypothetical protein
MGDEHRPDPSPHGAESAATPAPPAGAAWGLAGGDWLSRLLVPAYEAKGWLKFLGATCVVVGGLQALTIVGLLVAWVYIWAGVLLWQAGDRAGQATARHDAFMLEQYLQKLKTVIVIGGVVTAIGVLFAVFAILLMLTVGWVSWMAAIREAFPY